MKTTSIVMALLICTSAMAGTFKEYVWHTTFHMGADLYQPLLKIDYIYQGSADQDLSSLALPRDTNLSILKLVMKVDGHKVDPLEDRIITWWSNGEEVPVYLPPMGARIKVEATFVIGNIFLIPAAPTNLPIEVKKLECGFAPLGKFEFSGNFIGRSHKFKPKKIAARSGEPTRIHIFTVKNSAPNGGNQGLFYLIPKAFSFSFNLMRGQQEKLNTTIIQDPSVKEANNGANAALVLGGIGTQAGKPGSGNADTDTKDLKPYNMTFYKQIPQRDWQFAPTWMQQEYTSLPFGMLPGGRVKSRALFNGSGDLTNDLVPWLNKSKKKKGDAAPEILNRETPHQAIDLFIKDWRSTVTIDPSMSPYLALEKDGILSPSMANKLLATEIRNRYNLTVAPVLTTRHDARLAPSLPISAFHGFITGFQIEGRWFIVDAAKPEWDMHSASDYLKGKNALILADALQMATY